MDTPNPDIVSFETGKLDRATGMVPVTFTLPGWKVTREVRAVLTDRGAIDVKATRARCAQIADGLAHKAALGLLAVMPGAKEA